MNPEWPPATEPHTEWKRHRSLVREGFKDLEYMPRGRCGWNATLAAYAYGVRRKVAGVGDLALWAVMHGCSASARYQELGDRALVLWHGTSAQRAKQIREHGLFHKRGVWATFEPRIAHGYARHRSLEYGAGSATVVLVLDGAEVRPGLDYDEEGPEIVRFRYDLPREWNEYVLWGEQVEFVGGRGAAAPKPWGVGRFKKREGEWVPRSQPPVRFDSEHTYASKDEWLRLSIARVMSTLASASAIEVFSSLYSTIHPWDALTHEDVFRALGALCPPPRRRKGAMLFQLADLPGA